MTKKRSEKEIRERLDLYNQQMEYLAEHMLLQRKTKGFLGYDDAYDQAMMLNYTNQRNLLEWVLGERE